MSNLHDNDIHLRAHADSFLGSAEAEVTIDRSPHGVGPDARCAMLVSTISMGALRTTVRSVSLVRGAGRLWRDLRAALNDEEKLRVLVLDTARRTQHLVDAELRAIVAEVLGRSASGQPADVTTATRTPVA